MYLRSSYCGELKFCIMIHLRLCASPFLCILKGLKTRLDLQLYLLLVKRYYFNKHTLHDCLVESCSFCSSSDGCSTMVSTRGLLSDIFNRSSNGHVSVVAASLSTCAEMLLWRSSKNFCHHCLSPPERA